MIWSTTNSALKTANRASVARCCHYIYFCCKLMWLDHLVLDFALVRVFVLVLALIPLVVLVLVLVLVLVVS